jgi:hypothetical protein
LGSGGAREEREGPDAHRDEWQVKTLPALKKMQLAAPLRRADIAVGNPGHSRWAE